MSGNHSAILCGEAWIDARLRAHPGLAGLRLGQVGSLEPDREEILLGYAYVAGSITRFNGGGRYKDSLLFQVEVASRSRNLAKVGPAFAAVVQALDPTGRGIPPAPDTEFGRLSMCQMEREIPLPGDLDGVPLQRLGAYFRLHVHV